MIRLTSTIGEYIQRLWKPADIGKGANVLSEACQEEGGIILLPEKQKERMTITNVAGKTVSHIILPPQRPEIVNDHFILTDLQLAADRLLFGIINFQYNPDEEAEQEVRLLVLRYYDSALKQLLGKNGLLDRIIYGYRMSWSFRGVISYCPHIRYDEAAIPRRIANRLIDAYHCMATKGKLEEYEQPWVILLRHPVLHAASFRKLYIYPWDRDSIGVHPLMTLGQNADFDGDWEFGFLGSPWITVSEDFSDCLWDHELLLGGPANVDWSDPVADLLHRIEPQDACLAPVDVLNGQFSEFNVCKEIKADDIVAWAKGYGPNEVMAKDTEVAMATAIQKTGIGRIGNIAKMIRLFADQDFALAESGNHIVERASQELFDSKHELSNMFQTILDIFDGQTTIHRAFTDLKEAGTLTDCATLFLNKLQELHKSSILLKDLISRRCPAYDAVSHVTASTIGSGIAGFRVRAEILNRVIAIETFNQIALSLTQRLKDEHFLTTAEENSRSHRTPVSRVRLSLPGIKGQDPQSVLGSGNDYSEWPNGHLKTDDFTPNSG